MWLFLQNRICIHLTSTGPTISSETNFAGTKIGTKGIGTVAIDDVTDGWRGALIGIWNRHTDFKECIRWYHLIDNSEGNLNWAGIMSFIWGYVHTVLYWTAFATAGKSFRILGFHSREKAEIKMETF